MAAVIGLAAGLTTWIVFLILFAMSFGMSMRVIGLMIYDTLIYDTLTGHAIFLLVPKLFSAHRHLLAHCAARPGRAAQL